MGANAVRTANPVLEEEAYILRQKQVSAVIYALSAANKEHGLRVESFPERRDLLPS